MQYMLQTCDRWYRLVLCFVLTPEVFQLLTFMMRDFVGGDFYRQNAFYSGQCRLAMQHFWRASSQDAEPRTTKTLSSMHSDLHQDSKIQSEEVVNKHKIFI